MFFIVLEHLLFNGSEYFSHPTCHQGYVANAIIGFTYVGVNCFLLITGFFGTQFSWKKLLNLYFVCAFYELLFFVVYLLLGKTTFTFSAVANIVFPLSHSGTWFIRCYTLLLLFSPLIDKGLESLDKKQFQYVLLLFTVANIYFGWFWKFPQFNDRGFNIQQFVYLYIIGRYIKLFVDFEVVRRKRWLWLALYVLLAVFWGIVQSIHDFVHIVPHWNGWAYSSPVVIAQAICLLLFFSTLNVQSNAINFFARGTMAVFIVHMNRFLGGDLYNFSYSCLDKIGNDNIALQVLALLGITLVIQLLITLLDMPRLWLQQSVNKRF